MPETDEPLPVPDEDDPILGGRATALEGGPCGQTGGTARVAALLAHPAMWEDAPEPPGGLAALIARADAPDEDEPAEHEPAEPVAQEVTPVDAATPVTGHSGASPVPSGRPAGDRRPARRGSTDPTRPGGGSRGRRLSRPALAVAAALVLIAAVWTGVVVTQERPTATIALAGPQAHGTIKIIERDAGWRLVLDADGLPPAPTGSYYQGWAVRDGQYVPLGTFHMHEQGQVELWSGVPLRMFRRIEITSQRVGGGQQPGTPVLAGSM